ncbi:MAG TPA: DUF2145 domain-containing protein [Opitutaceae bacterium]|nr:DUF2145 domain-containing protein [Opitutaceae bacterium]
MKTLFNSSLRIATLVFSVLVFVAAPAQAGSSEQTKVGVDRFGEEAIRNFALKVNDQLDQHHVNVGIIARAGRPRAQMPRGISYTHVAFVVFEPVRAADGTVFHTYTVYNLYQRGEGHSDQSYLKQDLTYDFVAGTYESDIAVCVPDEVLQRRILAVIRSPAYVALHNPDYNLLTNPWVDRYDNCVTHTLKVCVAAIYGTDERGRIYDDIRAYFKPTPVHLGPLQAIGTNFIKAISREDIDQSGFQTATYGSLKTFLDSNHLMKEAFTVTMN